MFSSKTFIVSGLTFKSLIHFFFNFYLSIYLIYLFGCIGSSLWHAGSSLRHVGSSWQCTGFSLVVERGLQSAWALSLRLAGSVVVLRGLSCPASCGTSVP